MVLCTAFADLFAWGNQEHNWYILFIANCVFNFVMKKERKSSYKPSLFLMVHELVYFLAFVGKKMIFDDCVHEATVDVGENSISG